MPADYSRIHRLLKILTLIQGQTGWTARRLAQECGTTERTIYRDFKMLEGAGIPFHFDEQSRGYQVRRDFFLPPVQMTLEEALALVVLGEQVGGREQLPFTRPAEKAIVKLRGQLPAALRQELETIVNHVAVRLGPVNPPEGSADVYELVRAALSRKRSLLCEYDSVSAANAARLNGDGFDVAEGGEPFHFDPYTLFFSHRAWYAVGHHGGRGEVRCLKLNRFTRCEPTQRRFTIPQRFTLDDHLGKAWRMIRGSKRYRVELWFDPTFAETIADTHWHGTQEVIWNEDGSITFRCEVDGLEEIVWWVLSMGPHCVVRKPAELVRRTRELAESIVARYSTGT